MLRWGGDLQGGEPYVFQDPADPTRIAGFEVEIADALARRLGVRADVRAERLADPGPGARARRLRRRPERARGDRGARGAGSRSRARTSASRRRSWCAATPAAPRAGRSARPAGRARSADRCRTTSLRPTPGVDVVLYEGVEEPYLDLEHGRLDGVLLDDIIADRYGLVRPTLRDGGRRSARASTPSAVRPDEPALRSRRSTSALGDMIARRRAARHPRALAPVERRARRRCASGAARPTRPCRGRDARLTRGAGAGSSSRGRRCTVVISVAGDGARRRRRSAC